MKGGFLGRHQPKNIPDSAHTFSQPLSLKSCSSSENGGMETGIHLNLRSSIGGETSLTSSGRSSPSASTPSRIFSSLSAVISIYMNHPSLDFFSNINHHRKHHRAALGFGIEKLADHVADFVFHVGPVDFFVFRRRVLDHFFHLFLGRVHQIEIFFDVDESAARHLRLANDPLRFFS